MKLQSFSLTLAVCLGSVAAQSMTGLPDCAKTCATGAIPSNCNTIDVDCICSASSFISDMACCVSKECDTADQQAALEFANQICGGAGVSDLPKSATCQNTSSGTTTATASDTTTTAETSSTTSTSSSSSVTESATVATPSSSVATETATSSTTGSGTSTTASETAAGSATATATRDAAALLKGKDMGLVAGIAAGVAFLM